MMGTIFSVTAAKRDTPPMNTMPARMTTARPMTQVGMPKAVFMVSAMELDCTMQPINPSARMMATAKNPARNLPRPPLKAVVM